MKASRWTVSWVQYQTQYVREYKSKYFANRLARELKFLSRQYNAEVEAGSVLVTPKP